MYKKSSRENSYFLIGRLSMMRYAFIENKFKANRQNMKIRSNNFLGTECSLTVGSELEETIFIVIMIVELG